MVILAASKLIEVLNKEASLYEEILALSKNKKDIIVNGNVSELESITKLEQSMILRLGKLENEREDLASRLADELGFGTTEITLKALSSRLPKEQAIEMDSCCKKLSAVLNELKETNSLNSKLIKNSLDYINFSINILSSVGPSDNNYVNSGEAITSKSRNFFDMKF